MSALVIYIFSSIDALSRNTKHVAIDASFGTINAGKELYALFAELDKTGFSMGYLFGENFPQMELQHKSWIAFWDHFNNRV